MSNLEMRPIEIEVLHDYSLSDPRQVPAAGAEVAVYKQGATVSETTACSGHTATVVPVANTGRLQQGDTVSPSGSASDTLVVGAVSPDGLSLTLANKGSSSVILDAGLRVVATSAPVIVVTQQTYVPYDSEPEVLVHMFRPTLYSTLRVNGDATRPLSVEAISEDVRTLMLGNDSQYHASISLAVGDLLVSEAGDVIAVVTVETICPEHEVTAVPVNPMMPAPPAVLYPNGNLARPLPVTGVSEDGLTLTLLNERAAFTLYASDSLGPPRLSSFVDSAGLLIADPIELDDSGRARFYVSETRVDCVVTGGGLAAPVLLPDRLGGWVRGGLGIINAKDYPSIQDAIDALPLEGGTVLVPAGAYTMTDTLYTPCDRPCHLVGEGMGVGPTPGLYQGTTLLWDTAADMLRIRGDFSSVRALNVVNTSGLAATREDRGRGIAIGRRDVVDPHPALGTDVENTEYVNGWRTPQFKVLIEDVLVMGAPGWGVHVPGVGVLLDGETPEYDRVLPGTNNGGGTLSFSVDLKRVSIEGSRRYGGAFLGGGCTTLFFENCSFIRLGPGQGTTAGLYYVYGSRCEQAVFEHCTIEGVSPTNHAWFVLHDTLSCCLCSCWFEEDPSDPAEAYVPSYFIRLESGAWGGLIESCHFVRGEAKTGGYLRLIQIAADGSGAGLLIADPDARAVVGTTQEAGGNLRFIDAHQVDLGGSDNADITVSGAGSYIQPHEDVTESLPIQYGSVPRRCVLSGPLSSVMAGVVASELTASATLAVGAPPVINGNLVLNWSFGVADGQNIGSAMYWWGGFAPGWRLANNAPTLTTAQRNARSGWVQGDLIYNASLQVVQIRIGGAWRTIELE